jgi:hypothetical protein
MEMIGGWIMEETQGLRALWKRVWNGFLAVMAFLFPVGIIILAAVMAGLLSGCAPDPRKQAAADVTVLEAQQNAKAQEQARAQAQQSFEYWQGIFASIRETMVSVVAVLVRLGGYALTIAICVAVIRAGNGVGKAAEGLGTAAAEAARMRAQMVFMDPKTMAYPMLVNLQYEGHGIISAFMPMTDKVVKLDTANPADRQMIATFGAQNLAIGVAYQARMANDSSSEGVAAVGVKPVVINAMEGDDRNIGGWYEEMAMVG